MGAVGVGDLEVVGRTVQDLAVVRRVVYLVCWSGVRASWVGGLKFEGGKRNGVRTGLMLPS